MLQKYFPILSEINSPLAMLSALEVTASAAKVLISGVSNETLESLLAAEVSTTEAYRKEVVVAASEIEAARKAASKTVRALRYRAAQAARSARATSKLSRQVKAVKKPVTHKATLRGLSGLSINFCRTNAASAQVAVRVATGNYNAALEAVELAVDKGGDIRTIRTAVAALKVAVRELEVRHLEFRFAREMLAIALARHSA